MMVMANVSSERELLLEVAASVAQLRQGLPPPRNTGFDFIMDLVGVLLLSIFINICFLVAEIVSLKTGPQGERRLMLEAYAHILTGPVSFIAFFNQGFTGSFLFFCTLWHFLCKSGRGRPSYILAWPCHAGITRLEAWWWFEAFLMWMHHVFIGAFKLALDLGFFDLTGSGSSVSPKHIIRIWLGGACLSHLSHGMVMYSIRGGLTARLLSVLMRMGGEALLITTQTGALRAGMILDMAWMTTMLLTLATFPKVKPAKGRRTVRFDIKSGEGGGQDGAAEEDEEDEEDADAAEDHVERAMTLRAGIHAMARLPDYPLCRIPCSLIQRSDPCVDSAWGRRAAWSCQAAQSDVAPRRRLACRTESQLRLSVRCRKGAAWQAVES